MIKTGLFRGNVIVKGLNIIGFYGNVENYEKHEFLGKDAKYLRVKEIKEVKISPNDPNILSILFEGYFDEEAIEQDKRKALEDALVEKVTKAVLEKIEEKDKKTVNVEGAELPNVLLEQLNKTIQDSLNQLKQSFESDLKLIDNKKIKNPYPTEKVQVYFFKSMPNGVYINNK